MHDRNRNEPEADLLAEIIRAAGNRRRPPQAYYDEVFAASHSAWRQRITQRRQRRWLAAAASVLVIAVLGAILVAVMPGAVHEPATVMVARGAVEQRAARSDTWTSLGPGDELANTSTRIRTGADGSAALMLANGGSLRLGADTDVVLARGRLELESGLLYFDSWGRAQASTIEVATPLGLVRDIGTQFELYSMRDLLRVRVRSGAIELSAAFSSDPIRLSGAEIEVTEDGSLQQRPIAPDGKDWAWAEALASVPGDGRRTIFEYLSWIAREKGKALAFDSPAAEQRARIATFSGDPTGLTPLELLAAIAATSGFRYEMQGDGTILIRR